MELFSWGKLASGGDNPPPTDHSYNYGSPQELETGLSVYSAERVVVGGGVMVGVGVGAWEEGACWTITVEVELNL